MTALQSSHASFGCSVLRLGRLLLVPLLMACAVSHAAVVDLADEPISQHSPLLVRPNVMFILDDSGSMGSDYMPDDSNTSDVCFGVSARNKLFYDPTVTYGPPLQASGTNFADASFDTARIDGFSSSSGTKDLRDLNNLNTPRLTISTTTATDTCKSNSGGCSDSSNTTTDSSGVRVTTDVDVTCPKKGDCARTTTVKRESRFYWATLKPSATDNCTTANYNVVTDVSTLTALQRTNYANWYAYYRTRILAMRSGVGRAFGLIDPTRYRVGYSTISENGVTDGSKFLNIRNFDQGTQKTDFYSRLYGASTGGYTPLRPALQKAGKYFARRFSGQTDPVQYSCQRNYAILSTDGYWNIAAEPSSTWVPTGLDGTTAIGNQDGGTSVDRPMRDECTATTDGNSCTSRLGPGVPNTLADISMYFYKTDLRTSALGNCAGSVTGQDVCADNVRSDGRKDTATYQHMTTFTVGLGVSGLLSYRPDYETAVTGSYYNIRQGTAVWPNPVTSTSASTYTSNEIASRIDDLWHAAVNGRGTYFGAANANDMASSLARALDSIDQSTGSGSAAATSSLRPSSGDDWIFYSTYTTVTWEGNVRAYRIDTSTGAVLNPTTPIWEANTRIANQGARNVYMRTSNGGNNLASLTYANMSSAQKTYFDNLCAVASPKLAQCAALTSTALGRVTGANVVDYLRGVRTYEMSASDPNNQIFRARTTPLGDVINAAPVYVKKSPLAYADSGYDAFKASTATRQAVLYVAANDGMLHAIKVADDATGGTELWAYVPTMVINNMWRLADTDYERSHRYFVDGTPAVGDVFDGSNWRTILVGGLNAGGRGYYALDITDPTAPRALWEYSVGDDNDLGYTFGNPVITKLKNGTWAVAFSSGYNNVSPGNGNGQLFVLNAATGALISKTSTNSGGSPVGTAGDPSNLGKINAYVPNGQDNTSRVFYGGDMKGNVWRFDHDDNVAPSGREAFLLAKTTGADQPITTAPTVSVIPAGSSNVVLSVATGRLLGASDLGSTATQSLYVFKDDMSTNSLGQLNLNPGMVQQVMGADRRVANVLAVDWNTQAGWYVNFNQSAGERVNIDLQQQYTQLAIATNSPDTSPCTSGGTSNLYYFDLATGRILLTYNGDALTAGITTVELASGRSVTYQQSVAGRLPDVRNDPARAAGATGSIRRAGWRELYD
jgi:type IV pilus assembly protein PilY1